MEESYYDTIIKGNNRWGGVVFSASPATEIVAPTGSVTIPFNDSLRVNIPLGVNVAKCELGGKSGTDIYVGVSPNSSHMLYNVIHGNNQLPVIMNKIVCDSHGGIEWCKWQTPREDIRWTISWSSEINTHTPDITDY